MIVMSDKLKGTFSASLLSLQLQLKTLLEDAGGEQAVQFLNTISNLHQSEQGLVLEVFTNILNRIISGEQRLLTEGDLARKEFEDSLYTDILTAMRDAAHAANSKRLSVVSGGKSLTSTLKVKRPISLCEARKTRKTPQKPILN